MKTDWIKIKNEYITTQISYQNLANKHKISMSSLSKRAVKEGWKAKKEKYCKKIETKVQNRTAESEIENTVRRMERINAIKNRLIDRIEQATEELNRHEIVKTNKIKTIKYDAKIKKPVKETIEESEIKEFIEGDIDRMGLKQLTSALRDLCAIVGDDEQENQEGGVVLLPSVLPSDDNSDLTKKAGETD